MRSSATRFACRRINRWSSSPSESSSPRSASNPPLAFGAHPHSSPEETAAFNRAVQAICHEAHRLDLRAEELVIAIKQAWSQLAAVRKSRLGERDSDVLRRVVSSSIEVFFESRDADGRRAQLPEQQTE